VPQRIFDIMAYGGFVLSNYQPEFETLFTPGYDIAVFRDLAELKEQTAYYLSHEKERTEIAVHGYQTVNRLYSYEHQLNEILSICEKVRQEEVK
jgi:spore maturation protein CgeB